jgi:hypothetical protein
MAKSKNEKDPVKKSLFKKLADKLQKAHEIQRYNA